MCAATSAGSLPARAAWGPSVACAEGCAGMCRSCRFPREPARAVTQPKSAKPRAAAGGWGAAGALAAAQAQGCGQAVVPTAAQGGSCGAGALRAPQWSRPHRHPHRSRLALFSASSPDASEYPWQKVPSRHRRSPGTIYSPALPSAVMLAPHRGRGRLARPEHPTGHWLAQPGHPRKAQGTASTAGVAVPVDFADQLLPEWSAWAQGVPPRREGLAARDRGGITTAPRVCMRLLPAGRGLARHRVGWWSRWVSWGASCPGWAPPGAGGLHAWRGICQTCGHRHGLLPLPGMGGTSHAGVCLQPQSGAAALWPPAALQLLLAVPRTEPCTTGSGRGLAVAAPAVPGLATPHSCPRCVLASAGSCRPCCVVPSTRGKPQLSTAGEVGGCSRRVTVFQHTVHSPKQMQIQVSQNRSSAKNNWEKMLKKSKYFF